MSTTDDPEVELANSLQLWDYIQSLVSIAFDSNHTPSTKEFLLLQTYISDLNIRALYLLKLDNGYLISLDPILKAGPALAFIKRFATLVKSMPFHDQLLMINLPQSLVDSNGYSMLFNYLKYAISPFFDSTQLNDDKDAKNGLNLAKKKLAELELSLVHLQQNVAIPDIHLRFHPQIEQLIAASVKLGEKPSSIDFSNLLDDSKFLNEIQKDVNIWIKEIQKVTHLTRDPASGSTRQEIEFWIYMEKSLALIENQLKSPEIILTLDILRAAKRFQATVSFMADTGIKEATEKVVKYNQLMKDFPINELLSATDFEKTKESLDQIFVHFNKKLRLSPYPISRALLLAEAISRDLNAQILKIFHGKKMLHIPYTEFVQITQSCQQVFETWEEQVKEFMSVAREVARKRAEKFLPIKVTSFHIALQERIEFIYSFRKQHEQLVKTIDKVIGTEREGGQVLGISDFGASKEVDSALDFIKSIDILDLSNDGVEALAAAETTYNDKVFQVEQQIIVRLRDRLGTAKNASDMFRVFSKFNALFVRPTIRGAIHEYQSQLIERVKDDIRKLHEKFMLKYSNSEALQFTQVRDVPPVSGSIIWAKGIEQQLNKYMKKVEYVLGKGWEQYAEGQKLQQEELSFKRQLDTLPIFQAWVQEETNREFVGGRIFSLTRNRLRGNQLELGINFDSKSISVFKEVRNLLWLGFAVPIQLQNIAKDSKRVYPFAVSLNETLRIYHKTLNIISENKSTQILTAGYHQAIQSLIARGIQLRWDYFINTYETRSMAGSENRHVVFVRELASAVSKFQEKLATAVQYTEQVELLIEEIAVIPYQRTSFETCLGKIQKNIDQLNFESFSNLDHWAFDVDKRIRAKLLERLQKALKEWNSGKLFEKAHKLHERESCSYPITHFLSIKNQTLFIEPPLQSARMLWIRYLQDWLGVITNLPRIQVFLYERQQSVLNDDGLYTILATQLDSKDVQEAYAIVDQMFNKVSVYVEQWLKYQALWDLELEKVYESLGSDLDLWSKTLIEVKKARSTFDTTRTMENFGPIVIEYGNVQTKVNAQYDIWQRDLISRFGTMLGNDMRTFYNTLNTVRKTLESTNVTSKTKETVNFILLLQDLKIKSIEYESNVTLFQNCQRVLERQRYHFGPEWLYIDQIKGEWSSFKEILSKKNKVVDEQLAALKLKIIDEDKVVNGEAENLVAEWAQQKPIQGDISPENALIILQDFESKFTNIDDSLKLLEKAKLALSINTVSVNGISAAMEELKDLQEVWNALSEIWIKLEHIKKIVWLSDECSTVRKRLEGIIMQLKEMPNRLRQYLSFQSLQKSVTQYVSIHIRALPLQSGTLRDRHWSRLLNTLGISTALSSLQVGQIWDGLQVQSVQNQIDEIVSLANGELALETYLKQAKLHWENYSLEFVNYQNKCRLVRGWDELFTKCLEHLGALNAMKNSIHFKAFKNEANGLEELLSNLYLLLDNWVKVQRQWVYLQAIFSGNQEIKQILPLETSRFTSIDTEFMTMLRKIYKSPLVYDVINIPNILQSMQRLGELLAEIQKSLGEYLERERARFARFYFIADEDLLEILGNTKDLTRIQPHFKKMFPAINRVLVDEESNIIGIASKEGEQIAFSSPVSRSPDVKIHEWLSELEVKTKEALFSNLIEACNSVQSDYLNKQIELYGLIEWMGSYPSQVILLAAQCKWTTAVEDALKLPNGLPTLLVKILDFLKLLAQMILKDLDVIPRKKCESLIAELVHQRDVVRTMIDENVSTNDDFRWLCNMRFYLEEDILRVDIANATFIYGFEYLGIYDRLIQTPLTDRCYLTLSLALNNRLGGSPYGPAGTGKTESVKAMAAQLGRHCLVFCCDEKFDFQSMGRIFIGLCKVGAWGCFDEFNRLEENILSAVSQQIQSIQLGLKHRKDIEIIDSFTSVHPNTGIFITMNPGYSGRSELPENLTSLFRGVAMSVPNSLLIAQVMLFSQGFRSAESLALKVIPFFDICKEQLSVQQHYDFGLRAIKSVLVSAGRLQRENILLVTEAAYDVVELHESQEEAVLVQSIKESVFPKLTQDDCNIATGLLHDIFPNFIKNPHSIANLVSQIEVTCENFMFIPEKNWLDKVLQLYSIQQLNHGIIIVGPSGSGKTAGWKALLDALDRLEGRESEVYLIDPKAITKDNLYGWLDPTTREWTDGIFTRILRTIVEDTRGESAKRHWITFDGDIDPEWVENLNSVLDDNKMLTLPNGERLSFPENVRIIFEVENVDQATPATISRCGMILFPDGLVSIQMLCAKYLKTLKKIPVDEMPDVKNVDLLETKYSDVSPCQVQIVELLSKYFTPNGFIENCVNFSIKLDHIMDFRIPQVLDNLFSLVTSTIKKVLEYYVTHPDILLPLENLESFVLKSFFIHTAWSLGGGLKLEQRKLLSQCMAKQLGADFLDDTVFDLDTELLTTTWIPWKSVVPSIDIEPHNIARHDIVIPTLDTLRHEKIIYSWLAEHRSVILCGPPGSGKTMTLFASLRKLPETDVVPINFSSETTSDVLIRTLELHGQYKRSSKGEIFSPKSPGRWLVLFCDEINLPKTDKYGTQRVISFIRQLIEQQGFWRRDRVWVKVERLQIIGACNPPTDQGRVLLTNRFLRHCPVILVDYPVSESLTTIYSTFCRAALKPHPSLRGYYEALTSAMINLYLECKSNFTLDNQLHYIFSPRELTRWIRGIYEITKPMDFLTLGDLIRIWAHEGLRLFQDRLVHASERDWMLNKLNEVAMNQFPGLDFEQVLKGPILFSNFLSNGYESTDEESLTEFISARLQVFYEEESDIPIVLFNSAVNHILRIDRVFRQSQGHLLLIGISGSGKSTLTRFVAWMNGISVYQPSMHSNYSSADFDDDLRVILRRSGYQGEKICFILDQSNILETTFLERINTLLANSEIPGLFEGDDFSSLMSSCKEASQREGFMFETHEELYKWFTTQVARNLHVVFTMNPPNGTTNTSTTSPALFNRCVLNWMGDWDYQAFYQVANEYTSLIDLDNAEFKCPSTFQPIFESLEHPLSYRDIVLDFFIYCHRTTCDLTETLKKQFRIAFITPRQFIDFVALFTKIYQEKRSEVEERQKHLIVGLERLRETFEKVEELKSSLDFKNTELESKSAQANAKLKKMVDDQQQAENSRAASVSMQQALSQKNIQIAKRKDEVLVELALAEPAVIEAQQSVSSIKRQHLTEVRAMGNPPSVIKLAMESVCILLGYKVESWKNVQVILRRDDFISSIVNYDTSSLTQRLRDEISSNYLNDPSYTFETIDRASKACGPLAKWVMAQVQYSAILERVGPLRDEVKQLEESAFDTEKKATETNKMIDELEERISIYKEEYAALISEVQTLKTEMEAVKVRVSRSMHVLDNLSSEKSRWSESKESFAAQMDTLVGDVLLASAFTAYVGYFDQNNRQNLLNLWKNRLEESKISYQKKLSLPEYLSSAEERSQWVNNHLPDDKLCIENAVMISKKQRYPLLIDPAGQALSFLQSFYKSRSIVTTSFRDISFLKSLESALRFGNPIIIQDVEDYNPILNTVLNKELKRSGGRNLIKLGKKEIDFSSSFELFLFTKNPNLAFTPDISSRVTFINFTITPASLTIQCLDKFLKVDRPDIDKKRKDLLKLQGEFQLRLHFLERALLNSLNETDGNIMDDENAMRTLEVLKEEATDILLKVAETDKILVEVDTVTDLYQPLAQKSSAIYFCIEQLEKLELFYQFSLEYYFQLFEKVLDLKQSSNRIADLENYLFLEIYEKISVSLRQEDLMVFALLLAQIKAENGDTVGEWTFLFQSHVSISDRGNDWAGLQKILDSKNVDAIYRLSKLKSFSTLVDEIVAQPQIFRKFINSDETSTLFSELSSISSINFQKPINRLLLLNCIYTSDVTKILLPFLKDVLGDSFSLHPLDNKLSESISTDIEVFRPVILCSDKGYDVSRRVETLSASLSKTILAVAMGSAEGVQQADSAIAQGIRTGCWVLIKNAHLDIPWLVALEKRLLTIKSTTFKLFITVEIHPRIPVNLLRACKILTFEPPVGIRSSVLESVRLVPKIPSMLQPVEKGRVLFMLAWLHGIIIERTRYLPIGWTKKYDFNDSDFELAAALINVWFDRVSQNKSNIDPKNIPWNALTSLISQTVYGGKINSLVDQRLLEHLVSSAFHPGIYDIDFALAKNPDESLLILPDVIGMEKFAGWVSTLPENQPPTWIGLASTSDDLLTSINSSSLFKKLRKFVDGSQDSSTLVETEWTNVIKKQIAEWENALPNDMKWEFEPNSPMEKFFHGEFRKGKTVVGKILLDLKFLNSILDGLQGHTNYSRLLLSQIRAGITPSKWITYTVPTNITCGGFIADLSLRLNFILKVSEATDFQKVPVWLGGLFDPQAFFTATRQTTAKLTSSSLESLKMSAVLGEPPKNVHGFKLTGLKLYGANITSGSLKATDEAKEVEIPLSFFWTSNQDKNSGVDVPVYINYTRSHVLFHVNLDTDKKEEVIKRSVAIIA